MELNVMPCGVDHGSAEVFDEAYGRGHAEGRRQAEADFRQKVEAAILKLDRFWCDERRALQTLLKPDSEENELHHEDDAVWGALNRLDEENNDLERRVEALEKKVLGTDSSPSLSTRLDRLQGHLQSQINILRRVDPAPLRRLARAVVDLTQAERASISLLFVAALLREAGAIPAGGGEA